jgi:hypothetical protein
LDGAPMKPQSHNEKKWLASLDVHNWRFTIKRFQILNWHKNFKLCKNPELWQTWNFWIGFKGIYIVELINKTMGLSNLIHKRHMWKIKANLSWLLLHHWHIDLKLLLSQRLVTKTFSLDTQSIH